MARIQQIRRCLHSFLNITNFVIFLILSRNYSTNDLLQKNEFVNSFELQNYYWQAQIYDSFLVLMNMIMLIQFTVVSRRVSLLFKIIGITANYLLYLMMAMIVWQVWGDKLSYFRNQQISVMYTMALFDLKSNKSMYLGDPDRPFGYL